MLSQPGRFYVIEVAGRPQNDSDLAEGPRAAATFESDSESAPGRACQWAATGLNSARRTRAQCPAHL
jgi:hypothetical protein